MRMCISCFVSSGGFLINRDHKDDKTTVINFRETAPQSLDELDAAAITPTVSNFFMNFR